MANEKFYRVMFSALMPVNPEPAATLEERAKQRARNHAGDIDDYIGSHASGDPLIYRVEVASVEPHTGPLPWDEEEND